MTKGRYKGSLRLDWINKDLSLYYEIDEKESRGVRPVWVPKNDIRVAEPRILRFIKNYGDTISGNMLIKGDNLLVLRSLVEMFKGKSDKEKVKCIYIDPPFNTGNAFEKYDDNLQYSEWLTMMRDRLKLLRSLLSEQGSLWCEIDDTQLGYLNVLLDEVFGRANRIATITIKRSAGTGHKAINPGPINVTDYLFGYAKVKNRWSYNTQFVEKNKYDKQYSKFIPNIQTTFSKWKIQSLTETVAKEKGFQDARSARKAMGKIIFEKAMVDFALANAPQVIRFAQPDYESVSKVARDYIDKSKLDNKIYCLKREKHSDMYFYEGSRILFLSDKVRSNDEGDNMITEKLNNFWDDIAWQGISGEGGVDFQKNKKPEKLLKRIIALSTNVGDVVLDSFAGSGTTCAVAHKMNRKWIAVEMGRHAEDLILPRMQRVISGKDQTGISKEIGWTGGAGFNYFRLGESVINEQDMNWTLKASEIAEAVFLHFQYRPIKTEWLEKEDMYLGKHPSARYHFALSFVSREVKKLTEDLYEKIIASLDKEKFKHLTIFTNVAVSVPPESLDDRVLVKKIPAAILREYNLL